MQGRGTYRFANGDTYEGDFHENRFHGFGTFTFAETKDVYSGEFLNGKKHGQGELHTGEYDFKGTYMNDQKHRGTLNFKNGDEFKGEFKNDVRCGHGTLKRKLTGEMYDGQWANDKPNGQGSLSFDDDFELRLQYVGSFQDGVFHGHGRMEYAHGGYYVGTWMHGSFHGHGELSNAQGKFVGIFKHGAPSKGRMQYKKGKYRYDGQFSNWKKHGRGHAVYADGSEYTGEYEADRKNGRGILKYPNGESYEGLFKDDERTDCEGVYIYANSNVYQGGFKNCVPHGIGAMAYMDEKLPGVICTRYVGGWQDGMQHGDGKLLFFTESDGTRLPKPEESIGVWDKGVMQNQETNMRLAALRIGALRFQANKSQAEEELKKLHDAGSAVRDYCENCNDVQVNMMFLPCQHWIYCEACSQGIGACPRCNGNIARSIKTYLQ
jgi:hypothetical protein